MKEIFFFYFAHPDLMHLFMLLWGGVWGYRTRNKVQKSNTLNVLGYLSILLSIIIYFVFQSRFEHLSAVGNEISWLVIYSVMLLGVPIFFILLVYALAGRQLLRIFLFIKDLV